MDRRTPGAAEFDPRPQRDGSGSDECAERDRSDADRRGDEHIRTDDRLLSPTPSSAGDQFRIPGGVRQVEVRMSAISYLAPEALPLRYRLDGVDEDWKLAGPARTATYSNLPPGQRLFLVAASYAKSTARAQGRGPDRA